ncbi:DHHC palmitoyltransferase-domain-containing protein, partial [Vararia minispora EC-137]
ERADRRREQPQPWLARKFTVGLTACIMVYTFYVVVGRVCVPAIRHDDSALAALPTVGLLVGYVVLWIMMAWSYTKVIITPPGYALEVSILSPAPSAPSRNRSASRRSTDRGPRDAPVPAMPETARTTGPATSTNGHGYRPIDPSPPMPATFDPSARQPSTVPILRDDYRYCRRCEIVRPPRAHHCRACGTCVLKYDHHCPWVGQCVGARNHKFFLIFVYWAALYCLFVFGSLVGLNVAARHDPDFDVDPQHIVAIALAALFAFFTLTIGGMHTALILLNMTTVEQLGFRSQRERESERLAEMFRWWQIRCKRATRARWDAEWGRIDREGNLWWTGSLRRHWEAVMGRNKWTWVLPLGTSPSDGRDFERNPRFDDDGVWMPRKAWPEGLR